MFDDLIRGTFLENVYLGNRLFEYIVSAFIIIAGVLAAILIKKISLTVIRRFTKEKIEFYNMLETSFKKSITPALHIAVIYFSITLLTLTPKLSNALNSIVIIILTYLFVKFLITLIQYLIISALDRRDKSLTQTQAYKAALPALEVLIWAIGLAFMLSNLGFNISALIAGLGISGIAIALAAQAVFKDFFSYIAIILDKPFEIGDSINVDTFSGTVEHIGIKTTRVRSVTGEQIVFANSNLTDSRIRNNQKLEVRRVSFRLSISYNTLPEKLRNIPNDIKNIIEAYDDTVFDRSHFTSYEDSGFIFETVYTVKTNDYTRYMDIQQEVNLKVLESLLEKGIELGYCAKGVNIK